MVGAVDRIHSQKFTLQVMVWRPRRWSTPTLLVETAGGLGEGAVVRDDRDHQTEWGRIHGRKYVPKEDKVEAENLKISVSGEKEIGAKMVFPGKPKT